MYYDCNMHLQMVTHYTPVHFVCPITYTTTMQLRLFGLLNECRKDLKNGEQSIQMNTIFIDKDACNLLFSYILLLFFSITNSN